MLMGDGCLAKNSKGKRVYLIIEHGPSQDGYARHKAEFLRQYSEWVKVTDKVTNQHGGNYKTTRVVARLPDGVLRHLNKFDRVYRDNKEKIFSDYAASRITLLGLMYWFIDDGTAHVKDYYNESKKAMVTQRVFRLGTYGLDKASKKRVSDCFEKRFGIKTNVIKAGGGRTLHSFPVKEMKKLIDILSPYLSDIPKCVRYKFDMRYKEDPIYSRWSSEEAFSAQP